MLAYKPRKSAAWSWMIDSRENRTAILSSAAKEPSLQGAGTQNAGESCNPKLISAMSNSEQEESVQFSDREIRSVAVFAVLKSAHELDSKMKA